MRACATDGRDLVGHGGEGGGLGLDLVDSADHVEGCLGEGIVLASDNALECIDGVLKRHELPGSAGEDLGNVERLGHELLDLAGAGHSDLVLLRELVHAEDGNDVLQVLVVLERLLDLAREVIVGLADDAGVHHARGRVKGVDSGVDAELGNAAGQHSGGVKMGEGGGGSRIGKIVGGHVDGLHRGDGALGVGGDTLLEATEIRGEGGLVSDSRGDTSEKGRHLRVGLGEAEDVVDEEQHVLSLLVTEVLGDSETGEGDTGAGTWGLVHLAIHKGGLGPGLINLDHTSLNHLVVEVIALAGALADTGEHGVTSVVHGDVVDELHDEHSLADTGTAEEADLATLGIGSEEVDNLDARHKDLSLSRLLDELGGVGVDRHRLLGRDGAALVDGLADNVHDATKALGAGGNHDGQASVNALLSAGETLSGLHSNSADGILSEMLGDLEDDADTEMGRISVRETIHTDGIVSARLDQFNLVYLRSTFLTAS